MKLIAVISHKGGAGKTTSAVQIAEELARRGQRTLFVDADRQQGAGLLLGIDAPAGCVQRTTAPRPGLSGQRAVNRPGDCGLLRELCEPF